MSDAPPKAGESLFPGTDGFENLYAGEDISSQADSGLTLKLDTKWRPGHLENHPGSASVEFYRTHTLYLDGRIVHHPVQGGSIRG